MPLRPLSAGKNVCSGRCANIAEKIAIQATHTYAACACSSPFGASSTCSSAESASCGRGRCERRMASTTIPIATFSTVRVIGPRR